MKLPQKMSEALTNTMIEANIIKKEEHDIYSYCYEFLFENIVYIASIILFGALLHNLKETLIFLLVMIPFRTFAGGLHAPASGLCVVLSYLSYFITMLFCNNNIGFSILSHPAFFFLECFTICLMAPIDSSSKKWPTNIVKGIKKYVSFVVYWWSCYNSFSILTYTISFVIFYFFVVCCLYWMFPLLFLSSPYIIQKAVDK